MLAKSVSEYPEYAGLVIEDATTYTLGKCSRVTVQAKLDSVAVHPDLLDDRA